MKIDYCQWIVTGDDDDKTFYMFFAPAFTSKRHVWDYAIRLKPEGEWELTVVRKSSVEQISQITAVDSPISNNKLMRLVLSLDHHEWMQR